MTVEDYVKEIVVRGLRDYIQAGEVRSVVRRMGGVTTDHEVRSVTLAIVRAVLKQQLMTIGGLVPGEVSSTIGGLVKSEFREWQVPIEEAIARVTREWDALGRLPSIGEVFWLSNTGKGEQKGREWEAEEAS